MTMKLRERSLTCHKLREDNMRRLTASYLKRTRRKRSALNRLTPSSLAETCMLKDRIKVLSSWDSASTTTTTRGTSVNVDPNVVAAMIAEILVVAVDVVEEKERDPFSMLPTMTISQLSEADSPARAASKVNFKSLDCSHAFRCDE